jgi:hypothetical protein
MAVPTLLTAQRGAVEVARWAIVLVLALVGWMYAAVVRARRGAMRRP